MILEIVMVLGDSDDLGGSNDFGDSDDVERQ